MPKKFCITDLNPEILAPKVTRARKKEGWTVAELARAASVQFANVARVENADEEPGVLTSLNIALAAGVVDLEGLQPEPEVLEFATILGSDTGRAAAIFQSLAEDFLADSVGGRECVPTNLFSLYTAEPRLAQLQLIDRESGLRKGIRESIGRKRNFLEGISTPLPLALGVLSSESISLYRRKSKSGGGNTGPEASIPAAEVTFWRHLSANRTVNVGARRLVASLDGIAGLMEELKILSRRDYLNFATRAFVNYYLLEQAYEAALSSGQGEGAAAIPDFWKLIYDYVRMRQQIG